MGVYTHLFRTYSHGTRRDLAVPLLAERHKALAPDDKSAIFVFASLLVGDLICIGFTHA